jgi:hypothetical protein
MIPKQHQLEGAKWALYTVRQYGIAYLSWQERTGKTLTALLAVENSLAETCLIVTKKKAIDGWAETLAQWHHKTKFVLINYESVHKVPLQQFDFIILDEAHHAIASIGRPSSTWKKLYKYTKDKPIIYLSATPFAETVGQLYHQLKLAGVYSPWKGWSNYYSFHRDYGIPKVIYTAYGQQQDRSIFRVEEVLRTVDHLFNYKTREEVGIEHEPSINVVHIPLSDYTKKLIALWKEHRVLRFGEDIEVLGDSDSKMRAVHYQLEGGTLKIDATTSIFLKEHEKIDYIHDNYNTDRIAIMAHFIKERELLQQKIPKAIILSSDGDAEGVDLHRVDKLIVYSMSFKTSKHTQRTARQANHNRRTPIEVDILVCDKPAVGYAVYDAVAIKKENFVKSSYERVV